jgi:uncharacterized DUF497 family protein
VTEYDPKKDRANRRKHHISLSRAEDFDFEEALYSIDDREDYGEIRFRAIGLLDARLYTLVFVDEEESDDIRAISLRKATRREAKEYKESR